VIVDKQTVIYNIDWLVGQCRPFF